MRFAPSVALILLALSPAAFAAPTLPRPGRALAPKPGVVLIALRPGAALEASPGGALRTRDAVLASALARYRLTRPTRLSRAPAAGAARPAYFALHSNAPDFDPPAAARALRASAAVLAAAPDVRLQLHLTPNDPSLPSQWHLGTSDAAVRARTGWDLETGSPAVVVGILDTGVDRTHPDLAAKIWHNPGEIPANGIDDDGNGYVDDLAGWDFGNGDADANPEPMIDPLVGIDVGWHGTFVAGLAAASTNDGVGIAGVAWGCRVMPLKVSDATGDIPLSAIVGAVDYAIAMHASVLNLSLGTSDTSAAGFFQALVNDAFDGGIVVVASAGNDGTDALNWPAACDSVLSVGATNSGNGRTDFSNWGAFVDIAAPGEGLWSSIADNYAYDDLSLLFFELLWGWDGVNPYMSGDGTSFSAPVVAAAAALVRSRFPALAPQQVMRQLVLTGDVRAYDNPIGPRLNIQRALANPLDAAPLIRPEPLAFAAPAPNPAAGPVRFAFALPRAGAVSLEVLDAQGRRVCSVLDRKLGAGAQSATWDARDDDGRPVAAGLYFAVLRAGDASAARRIAVVR